MSEKAAREVDPWRFAGGFLEKVLSTGIPDVPSHPEIPWTPFKIPLAEAKVALLTTAGLSMKTDAPFDMEMERKRPTRGDPSWRAIRSDATGESIDANHLHIDTSYVLSDINVALPVDRLRELAEAGEIGSVAQSHYSIMGYQGSDSSTLVGKSAPEIAASLKSEEVDLVILAPV